MFIVARYFLDEDHKKTWAENYGAPSSNPLRLRKKLRECRRSFLFGIRPLEDTAADAKLTKIGLEQTQYTANKVQEAHGAYENGE
jgi:hypothetical protein